MKNNSIITPKVAEGFVSRQTNLGVANYDFDELYSPDTNIWRSKVLDLVSPKYPPQTASAPTRYWFDRSRYNNHGAITGAIWEQLPSGVWALRFDDSDDEVVVTDADILDPTAEITFGGWFKVDALEDYDFLMAKGADGNEMYEAYVNSLGRFYITATFSTAGRIQVYGTGVTAGKFHFGLGTYAAGNFRVYLDGVLKDTAAGIGAAETLSGDATTDLSIGHDKPWGNATARFGGLIGEVFVGNQALDSEDVMNLFLQTKWR